jgi:hypothetical protein
MTMLYRIVVDVIHVTLIITLVADDVFPKTPLPNTSFPLLQGRSESLSPRGICVANRAFISCQRVEKSASPEGNLQIQCR